MEIQQKTIDRFIKSAAFQNDASNILFTTKFYAKNDDLTIKINLLLRFSVDKFSHWKQSLCCFLLGIKSKVIYSVAKQKPNSRQWYEFTKLTKNNRSFKVYIAAKMLIDQSSIQSRKNFISIILFVCVCVCFCWTKVNLHPVWLSKCKWFVYVLSD